MSLSPIYFICLTSFSSFFKISFEFVLFPFYLRCFKSHDHSLFFFQALVRIAFDRFLPPCESYSSGGKEVQLKRVWEGENGLPLSRRTAHLVQAFILHYNQDVLRFCDEDYPMYPNADAAETCAPNSADRADKNEGEAVERSSSFRNAGAELSAKISKKYTAIASEEVDLPAKSMVRNLQRAGASLIYGEVCRGWSLRQQFKEKVRLFLSFFHKTYSVISVTDGDG